jgi:hypothetical protein
VFSLGEARQGLPLALFERVKVGAEVDAALDRGGESRRASCVRELMSSFLKMLRR